MTIDTWHASDDLLRRFANAPEAIDATTAASVEQHLVACATCRAVVAEASDPTELEVLWSAIADVVDREPTDRLGRLLARAGLDAPAVRVVAATGLLQAQALAVALVLAAGAVVAAREIDTSAPFHLVAPVVVLAAVFVGFHPSLEPAGEIAPGTPLFGFRLFCTRASVVLAAAMLPLLVASLLLPAAGWAAFAWVLPALALSLAALATGSRYPPATVAAALGVGWLSVLAVWASLSTRLPTTDWLLEPGTQVAAAVVVGGSLAVLVARRDHFDRPAVNRGGLWP